MVSDYYLVRKGYLRVKDLYSARSDSAYRYMFGFSWHAYASYLSGIIINIVGFAGAVGRSVPVGAQYIYNINYFSGFLVSFVMYWALTKLFPIPATSDKWHEVDTDVDEDRLSIADGQEVYPEDEHPTGKPLDLEAPVDQKHPKSTASSVVL